jgi:hypothetical protein
MFGRTKVGEPISVTDEAEAIVVEAEVSQEEQDKALLNAGHPNARSEMPKNWRSMTERERDTWWDAYDTRLDAYHEAYLRVHGVECQECAC